MARLYQQSYYQKHYTQDVILKDGACAFDNTVNMHTMTRYLTRLSDKTKPERIANEEDIDSAIISMYIEENYDRSLRDLASQIAFELKFPFYETLDLLKEIHDRLELGYHRRFVNSQGRLAYEFVRWHPGKSEIYYEKFIDFFNKASKQIDNNKSM